MQRFREDKLPSGPTGWRRYIKRQSTWAIRVYGPFEVETADGQVQRCEDGYLVWDMRHRPFAVPAVEFEHVYDILPEDPPEPEYRFDSMGQY